MATPGLCLTDAEVVALAATLRAIRPAVEQVTSGRTAAAGAVRSLIEHADRLTAAQQAAREAERCAERDDAERAWRASCIPVATATKLYGLTSAGLRAALRNGRLRGFRHDGQWFVQPPDVDGRDAVDGDPLPPGVH